MSRIEMFLKINTVSLEPWKNNLWSSWSCCTTDINPFNPLPPAHQSYSLITQCDDDVSFCLETCFILTRKCPRPWSATFIYHLFYWTLISAIYGSQTSMIKWTVTLDGALKAVSCAWQWLQWHDHVTLLIIEKLPLKIVNARFPFGICGTGQGDSISIKTELVLGFP